MTLKVVLLSLVASVLSVTVHPQDRDWENPQFSTPEEAVSAAKASIALLDSETPPASLRMFVDLTLAAPDIGQRHPSSASTREVVGSLLITYPTAFALNETQRRTVDRFRDEIPRQREILERRLSRFGFPDLSGLVYLRLVESVDAFSNLSRPSSDKMSQVGGVTYYCRYVVLPLSYVGERNLRELRKTAALNPTIDVNDTVRRWQRDSFSSLVNTFRHEMVHVHTNTTLDVPAYSDRIAYPTWFHEGTATYLAADPHSGLSEGYKEYQNVLFFLVQRYGVRRLQEFFAAVFDGKTVGSALESVYAVSGSEDLFASSNRWHRSKDIAKTGLWIAAIIIVIAAVRGKNRPYIGALQLLIAIALGLAVATGLAEHLYGLRGPTFVLSVKAGFAALALSIAILGIRRVRRFRIRQNAAA